MDVKTQKILSDLAKGAGLSVEFPAGQPIRILSQSDQVDCIDLQQPVSEQIYAVLQRIGWVAVQSKSRSPFAFPWYLNRAYEWEPAGDVVYKTRRVLRQKLNLVWHSHLWALCTFAILPCRREFRDFLYRNPGKLTLRPIVFYGFLKIRLARFLGRVFRVLFPKLN